MFLIILFLILVGLIDSIYLIYKNSLKRQVSCPLNGDCRKALGSKWNKFLGIKNEVWGILYYSGLLILLGLVISNFVEWFILLVCVCFGFLYSLFLSYVQVVKIKDYCFYCLVSAVVNLMLLVGLSLMFIL